MVFGCETQLNSGKSTDEDPPIVRNRKSLRTGMFGEKVSIWSTVKAATAFSP